MKLIYKDALLKELGITNEVCEKCAWGDGYGYCTRGSDFIDACDAIYIAPVIEERKTGKWIDAKYPFSKCSICECYFDTANNIGNFCPNCGTDMREKP